MARLVVYRKIPVEGQPLTRVIRQLGRVHAPLEAVAHVVAADDLAVVVLDPATLDLARARFFVARAAAIPAVTHHRAGSRAYRGCGYPAVALADGGTEQAAGDGAENRTTAAVAFPIAAGLVADGFG